MSELRHLRRLRRSSIPGIDLPYQLALPTYAATAWYHHKLPDRPAELAPLLAEVEHFAMTDYAVALGAGSTLPHDQREAIVAKLHRYTGLPDDYIEKSDLRVNGGQFEKTLKETATPPLAGSTRAFPVRRLIR